MATDSDGLTIISPHESVKTWCEQQDEGHSIRSFEALPWVVLNESTGEVHCGKCKRSERVTANPRMRFEVFMRVKEQFEDFASWHQHTVTP